LRAVGEHHAADDHAEKGERPIEPGVEQFLEHVTSQARNGRMAPQIKTAAQHQSLTGVTLNAIHRQGFPVLHVLLRRRQ
jgi:hypothetical protein